MAKTTQELIPIIRVILGAEDREAMGIGEFLQRMRSEVMSTKLLMEALERMAADEEIEVADGEIRLALEHA